MIVLGLPETGQVVELSTDGWLQRLIGYGIDCEVNGTF